MNRQIKFRALVPVNADEPKTMEYFDLSLIDDLARLNIADYDINQLMQFTGLNDKNGVEIFEGDILKGINDNPFASNKENLYKVIWGVDSWHIEKSYMSLQEIFNFCNRDIEIIGNVFENPELLK